MAVHLDEILATIRQRESGGNYAAKAPKSSASGAYQFIDSTWQGLLKRYQLSGPPHAADAPPALQDYVAGRYIADILKDHGGDIRAVPAVWYTGRYEPSNLDYVPSPGAGNSLSVRSYVDRWLQALQSQSPGMSTGGGAVGGPVVLDGSERPAAGGPTPLDTFLNAAIAQQGDRYVFGHEVGLSDADPDTFDCSELVQWAAAQAGVQITDGSWLQYRELAKKGADLSIDEALRTPGALLFTFSGDPNSGGRPSRAHVAISLGDGRVMEARNPRVGVLISNASDQKWTHAASIPELGSEQSAGWPATQPLPEAPPQFGLDSDADGLLDEHERFIGTNPFAPDTDLDGFVDGAELLDRTDPLDAASNVLAMAGGVSPAYIPPMSFAATTAGVPAGGMGGTPLPEVELPPVTLPPVTMPPASAPAAPAVPSPGPASPAPAVPAAEPPAPSPPAPAPAPAPAPSAPAEPSPEPGAGGDELLEVTSEGTGSAAAADAAGSILGESGTDPDELFSLLSTTAAGNDELAAYLDELGIDSADELHRLPTGFDVDDWA